MDIENLRRMMKENGIVGAGGAGFPTFMKIDVKAESILLNCAECEPLLMLHRQLLMKHAAEILEAFTLIADVTGAREAVVAIKEEYRETVEAVEKYLPEFPKVRIKKLPGVYPMGDEVVLIYEALGKVVAPGGLPIQTGVAVFNVETVYNVYKAWKEDQSVTDKLVTIVGEVEHPVTIRVPIGCSMEEAVSFAGNETVKDAAYFIGGPMMGRIGSRTEPVTKTTNAVLVLPGGHPLIQKKTRSVSLDIRRASSACCQCQMCTDLCPRHALGHPIEPHKFMRAVSNRDFQDVDPFLNTMFCSGCGLCEMYSCPQGLAPRTIMGEYKDGLKRSGVKPPADRECRAVKESREYRKVPEKRLEARLGLGRYHKPAPLQEQVKKVINVEIPLSQHIGAPALPVVSEGDNVTRGQLIAQAAKGLSVPIHASVDGVVKRVGAASIQIQVK